MALFHALLLISLTALAAPPVMLVVHPNRGYDPKETARPGIEAAADLAARRLGAPLYLLTGNRGWGNVAPHDEAYVERKNSYSYSEAYSAGGEHDLGARSRTVILAGGYFEGCLKNAFSHFVAFADWTVREPFHVYFVLDGIYTGRDTRVVRTLLDEAAAAGALSSDAEFAAFIDEHFKILDPFEYLLGGPIRVGLKNTWIPRQLDSRKYRFELWRGNRPIAKHGKGRYRVVMNFVISEELDRCHQLLTAK